MVNDETNDDDSKRSLRLVKDGSLVEIQSKIFNYLSFQKNLHAIKGTGNDHFFSSTLLPSLENKECIHAISQNKVLEETMNFKIKFEFL